MMQASRKGRDKTARRGHALALSRLVPEIARRAFRERGFAHITMIARWPEIVGDDLAGLVLPQRLRFRRGARHEGTLELRVAPARATEVQHRAPQIIERVNAYFGYRAVAGLQLVQGPLPEVPRPGRPPESAPAPGVAGSPLAHPVRDDRLRELMQAWSAAIDDPRNRP